jgi:hypothetical protein
MLYVHFSGSTFALIGLLSAALSPFVLVVKCPDSIDQVSGSNGAFPLWIGIRGFMIALFIMSIAEYLSAKDTLFRLSYVPLHDAMLKIEKAAKQAWRDRDPSPYLAPVPGLLKETMTFGTAAVQEPRAWRCRWKFELVQEVCKQAEQLRLDILTMRTAMVGADGKTGHVFHILTKVAAFKDCRADLMDTMEDARDLTYDMLAHEVGEFTGLHSMATLKGIETLDGYDTAIEDVNNVEGFGFPEQEIETLEDDLICQISIIFVMLNYANRRVAKIISTCVSMS